MSRKSALCLALSLLLMGQVLFIRWQEGREPWTQYQRRYFAAQKLSARQPQVVSLRLPGGKVELCLTCHLGIEEISPSHPIEEFGCTSCHGGNPLSLDVSEAHQGLAGGGNPAAFDVAGSTCGGPGPNGAPCHEGNPDPEDNLVARVKQSLMSTKAGEVGQARFALGLQPDPFAFLLGDLATAAQLPHPLDGRSQERPFRANCLGRCHLNAGAYGDSSRSYSGGCAACHYLYDPTGTYRGRDVTIPRNQKGHGAEHRLTSRIPYTQCNLCHNRGTHSLATMTFTFRQDLGATTPVLGQGRAPSWESRKQAYYIPQESYSKCEVSLDCIDCHTRHEVMGDPKDDNHPLTAKVEAQRIQCLDCHGTRSAPPASVTLTDPNDRVFKDPRLAELGLPPLAVGSVVGFTSRGDKLPFVRFVGTKVTLYSKVTGKAFPVPIVFGSGCEQSPEQQSADACHRCHDLSPNFQATSH